MCSPVKLCLWLKTPNHKIFLPFSHFRETGYISLKEITVPFLPGLPGNSMSCICMGDEGPSQFIPVSTSCCCCSVPWSMTQSFLSVSLDHLLQQQIATSRCVPWLRNVYFLQSPFPPGNHCSCCSYFCTLKTLVLLVSLLNNHPLYCVDCLWKVKEDREKNIPFAAKLLVIELAKQKGDAKKTPSSKGKRCWYS